MPAGRRAYYESQATVENLMVYTGYAMDDNLPLPGALLPGIYYGWPGIVIEEGMTEALGVLSLFKL